MNLKDDENISKFCLKFMLGHKIIFINKLKVYLDIVFDQELIHWVIKLQDGVILTKEIDWKLTKDFITLGILF